MTQKITLYVDGACRGNPGLGGWGAYVVTEHEEHKLCGGELATTNNRMELTAAIEGISFCTKDAELTLWTDSNYVKRGITEWIEGWKKKNWKDVKNPDLWQKLDAVCKERNISWNWVKGHAGHAGNEMADQLANTGADQTAQGIQTVSVISAPISSFAIELIQNTPNGNVDTVATPAKTSNNNELSTIKKKVEDDWLLNDPFGFDFIEDDSFDGETVDDTVLEVQVSAQNIDLLDANHQPLSQNSSMHINTVHSPSAEHEVSENKVPKSFEKITNSSYEYSHDQTNPNDSSTNLPALDASRSDTLVEADPMSSTLPVLTHDVSQSARVAHKLKKLKIQSHIVITEPKLHLQGPRQLILDTETTGFYYQDGDRIIEVGAIEMINRKLTGSSIHIYINPKKPVGDSENVHGISDEFLKDKPLYAEIAEILFEYLEGAEIIAHNATFDMNFLDMEFKRAGFAALSDVCSVTDTLVMAKSKHPGQKNSLDALVRRYEIPQRDRTFHGALLDAEILSDVYLAMTGGQVSFDMDALSANNNDSNGQVVRKKIDMELPVILANTEELEKHENWIKQYLEKHGKPCLFEK